ncbi:MAG: prolyl oligopeptidase family serine peptidase, partial [Fimbriimonadaceae bacterium]
DKKPKARTEAVKWKGALEEEVEGMLYYPHDYKEGQRYPLMLNIHGGPYGQDMDHWSVHWAHANQILCEKGCFVLCPNYHGSSGYGQAFGASIRDGHYYDYPLEDIRNGVDHLIEKGLVDAERMGTSGWSNGAILSTALIVEDQRFKVASAGAGGSEWVADWGVCDFGLSFLNYYMGKSPLEDPELYIREAPLFKFHQVQTPTIFFHGTADGAVPYHHSMVQFHAMQEATTVQTRFVSFDDEPHGLQNRTGKLRKIREEMEWIGRFLLQEESKRVAEESLKKGSRLANWLKAKEEAASADGLYGELVKNRLVPELVEHKELKVGRFPVTWAQFSVFKADMTPGSHTGNYPATVSYEWAEKYCAWLSKLLGSKVRLPNREEAETLADLGAAANTLDDWAGYAVNPDDEQRLKSLLEGHEARLLKPADENGVGEEPVLFDVNGNAAEWFNDDGKPKLRGPAADSANDEKVRFAPRTKLTGFRVVEETPKEGS